LNREPLFIEPLTSQEPKDIQENRLRRPNRVRVSHELLSRVRKVISSHVDERMSLFLDIWEVMNSTFVIAKGILTLRNNRG